MNELLTMTDKQIQDWLRKISVETDTDVLPIALLGVNNEIKDCVFRNMSRHARDAVSQSIQDQNKKGIKESEIQKCMNVLKQFM